MEIIGYTIWWFVIGLAVTILFGQAVRKMRGDK